MIIYAGIGSRKSPTHILTMMTNLSKKFSSLNYLLRSGGALGADKAFESGAQNKEIFLANDATSSSMLMASKFHPAWDKCSSYAQKLHGRNMMIVLGKSLDKPVDFIVCWTPNAAIIGGTGQALRAAAHHKIPVCNLANPKHFLFANNFLEGRTEWITNNTLNFEKPGGKLLMP